MAPFEALYGRRYRSSVGWFDAFKVRPWGTDILRELLEKVEVIQAKILVAQSQQKIYADRKVRDLEFAVGHQKYHADGTYIVHWHSVVLDENLTSEEEPIAILGRQVRKLRSKEIASEKV
ncbi:uncharacterized protein LOC132624208 [Lycium barbarum]|uniref:uncharacterized protein LOC132624208 n=1 Tax=Lycium barbarum TaxID=112863 RepID=UPI00293E1B29|nr:uncharacterized protein LOC132624208 [Lycium barbarum]